MARRTQPDQRTRRLSRRSCPGAKNVGYCNASPPCWTTPNGVVQEHPSLCEERQQDEEHERSIVGLTQCPTLGYDNLRRA